MLHAILPAPVLSQTAKTVDGGTKEILKGVSGYVEPNHMLALMGPSGSGGKQCMHLIPNSVSRGSPAEDHTPSMPSACRCSRQAHYSSALSLPQSVNQTFAMRMNTIGKTTMLDVLSGRLHASVELHGRVSGSVRV